MIPSSPPPPPHNDEQTAVSGPNLASTPAPTQSPTELTAASGPTDATVVRVAPSARTLNEINEVPDANSFGKYELVGEVARGGMGVVYRARQHGLDRLVALKMVLGTGTDQDSGQRFLQEARAAAALDHPNVVPIYDTGEINGRAYFTMALIDGPNLRNYAESRGTLPVPEVVALFAQVVEGVAHAHAHGIIHRDLKPANVLMDKDGRPRVTDFGLAKRTAVDSALTATGQVVGTPQYMAPEQARDSKDVGPPADVYSLGAILYFLLTGRPPFIGESFTDLLIKVVTDAPIPPSQLRPDVPADLEAVCLRCLAKQPAERFASAEALAAALLPIVEQYQLPGAGRTTPIIRIGALRPAATNPGTVPDLSAVLASAPARSGSASVTAPAAPTVAAPAVPAPPAVGPRDRRPVIIGLAALVVVLVALIGYLATRNNHPESAKNEPPEGATTPPALTPRDPAPEAFVWPPPTRADFGLKVDSGEKQDADGISRVKAGHPLKLRLTAEKDCRVTVWYLAPTGNDTRLFPNDDDQDDHLTAGKERTIPGNDRYIINTTETEGTGVDRLRVIATTGKPLEFPPGSKDGRYESYSKQDHERLVVFIRGIGIKKIGKTNPAPVDEIAEKELQFRVQK
jgi:serine/threonine protein kinase